MIDKLILVSALFPILYILKQFSNHIASLNAITENFMHNKVSNTFIHCEDSLENEYPLSLVTVGKTSVNLVPQDTFISPCGYGTPLTELYNGPQKQLSISLLYKDVTIEVPEASILDYDKDGQTFSISAQDIGLLPDIQNNGGFTKTIEASRIELQFDNKTLAKPKGEMRVMLVDGPTPQQWTHDGLANIRRSIEYQTYGKNLFQTTDFPIDMADTDLMKNAIERIWYEGPAIDSMTVSANFKNAKLTTDAGTTLFYITHTDGSIDVGTWINTFSINQGQTINGICSHTFHDVIKIEGVSLVLWDTNSKLLSLQLEIGNIATEYEPCVHTTDKIDLRNKELCSLPDGTHDELTSSINHGDKIIKRVGYIKTLEPEKWEVYSTEPNSKGYMRYTYPLYDKASSSWNDNAYTNGFKWNFGWNTGVDGEGFCCGNSLVMNSSKQTLQEFVDSLPHYGVEAVYPLETPYEITPTSYTKSKLPSPIINTWVKTNIPDTTMSIDYKQDANIAISNIRSMLAEPQIMDGV